MKVLLVAASLQLLLTSGVFTTPGTDYWEEWGPYGECSRTCGGGVTVRTRRCVTQRTDGGHNCVGPEKSYRSCNIQDCPEGSRDFREEQCSEFDGTDFHGKRYKWLPYYGAENPCELNCIPRGENFYYRHRSSVVDGTPCHPGRRDICVEGVCRRLGCDSMLESTQEEDPCLQCGGNGQSCHLVKNTFSMRDLPKGYNQMIIIPVGATSIRISETVPTRNYLAIKNLRGEYYLNGHWVIEFSRGNPIAGTMLYYQRGTEGEMSPETIIGRGPTTEPLVIELITQEPNQGVEYEYYLPNGRSREGYYWSYGSWSSCSKECGSGYQSRLVFCTIDNEAYPDYLCASLPRPLNNRTCNEQQCPLTHSWKVGEWNQCSVTCGGGSQVRRVECVSHDASGVRVVEDSLCEAYTLKPLSQQNCNMQQCSQYSVSAWSQCSVTCGTGEQTRDVVCVGLAGNRLEDHMCGSLLKPPSTQACEMPACRTHVGWHVGDWGLCSKSCSSGLRERQVICSDTQRNLYGAEHCNAHPKPPTVDSCNTQPCSSPQAVPSMQDPRGYDNTIHGFHPYAPEEPAPAPQPNAVSPVTSTDLAPHCTQTPYGCCPDGRTPASGPRGQGCQRRPICTRTRYGCCEDGVSRAHGPNKEGCPEYVPLAPTPAPVDCRRSTYGCCYDGVTSASGAYGEGCPNPPTEAQRVPCELPHTAGLCDQWTARYYYDRSSSRCIHFWYGGCHGNSNNFATIEECQRMCQGAEPVSNTYSGQGTTLSRVLYGASAAQQAHHARVQIRARRPAPRAVENSSPAASWTEKGVSIDKSDPSTVEGLEGQLVVLPCRVSPPPSSTVTVEWNRDGIPLNPSRHRQQPNGSLLVGPVTVKDSGWLLCVATRDRERDFRYIYLSVSESPDGAKFGTTEKDPADSLVIVPNNPSTSFRIDRSGSRLVEARVGQTARLHCTVLPSAHASSVSIQWVKSGVVLNTLRHTQQSDGTLVINNLTPDDSGVYTCTAASSKRLEQFQIQLRVSGDVRITTAPNNVRVSQGSTAQLPCVVSGENVNVGWSRNGVPVRPDGQRVRVLTDGTLVLHNVQPADEGSYTCNAYAGTYSVSATADIRVIKDYDVNQGLPPDCVDEPQLANCHLIVSARLCGHRYYSSFCCASCYNYAMGKGRPG